MDINTYPVASSVVNLIFYVHNKHKIYLGRFDGTRFLAYQNSVSGVSFRSTLIGNFDPETVAAYITLSRMSDNDFKQPDLMFTDKNVILLCQNKIGQDKFITLETAGELQQHYCETISVCVVPELPECITKTKNILGRFKWCLVDNQNGIYVYNFYKKWLFWWFSYGIETIEESDISIGFNKAEKLLKIYYEENQ